MVVVDDEDRENEGDLIFAAEMATPELLSFMVRYTSGYVCVALTEAECDRLDLPPMHHTNGDHFRTAFTVTVDAQRGRDHRHLGRPTARTRSGCSPTPSGRRRTSCAPGTCCRCAPARAGCCAAPVTPRPRSTWPGWRASARRACCARSCRRRTTARWPAATSCAVFAEDHDLTMITIADLIAYRRRFEKHVLRVARATHPHAARRLHRLRLRLAPRRHRAHRPRDGRRGRGG